MLQKAAATHTDFLTKTENDCWRLAENCARWAAETQDWSVRKAFMAMAKELNGIALQEIGDE
jgi:hypothetical protein